MSENTHVHYGCGWCSAPSAWRNFDASPTLRFERLPVIGALYRRNERRFPDNVEYGDIVRGLPVVAASCRAVYCSHVLEHLSLSDCRLALLNTLRILQPGGTFRLVVPDLEESVRRYIGDHSSSAALQLMRDTRLGCEARPKGLAGFVVSWLGNAKHLWMWDWKALKQELEQAGFIGVRRASLGDAADPLFGLVEDQDRWDGCLGIECRRPL